MGPGVLRGWGLMESLGGLLDVVCQRGGSYSGNHGALMGEHMYSCEECAAEPCDVNCEHDCHMPDYDSWAKDEGGEA